MLVYHVLINLLGVGAAFIYIPSFGVINHHFDKRKALAMAISTLGAGSGVFIAPMMIIMFDRMYGFTGCMMMISAVNLHACICGFVYGAPRTLLQKDTLVSLDTKIVVITEKSANTASDDCLLKHKEDNTNIAIDVAESKETKNQSIQQQNVHNTTQHCATSIEQVSVQEITKCEIKTKHKKQSSLIFLRCCASWSFLSNHLFTSLVLASVGFGISHAIATSFSPALYCDHGLSTTDASFIFALSGISDSVARIVLGFVFDWSFIKSHRAHVFNICHALGEYIYI